MDLHLPLLLLHVLATGGLFAAFGIEVHALHHIRACDRPEQVRPWLAVLDRPAGGLGQLSMLVLLATGMWMALAGPGLQAWTSTALAAIAAMFVVAMLLGRPALKALTGAVAPDRLRGDWRTRARSPRLLVALLVRTGLLLGIVGLMTLKPGLAASIAVVAAPALIGLAVALVSARLASPTAVAVDTPAA